MTRPPTRFAWNGDVSLAYQVCGDGPTDLLYLQGYCSNVDMNWDGAHLARFLSGLAAHARLVITDRRGWGCSERFSPGDVPDVDTLTDDVLAVMKAAGSDRASILATYECAIVALLFMAGFLRSLFFTASNALVFADVGDREASQATAIAAVTQQITVALGVAVGGGILEIQAQLGDGLPAPFVLGLPRATIAEACQPKGTIVLLGPDPKEALGVLYLRLRHAVTSDGATLIELAHGATGMTSLARHVPYTTLAWRYTSFMSTASMSMTARTHLTCARTPCMPARSGTCVSRATHFAGAARFSSTTGIIPASS